MVARTRECRRIALLGIAALLIVSSVRAASAPAPAVPRLDQLYPIAVPAGATTPVAAAGKFTPWPPKIWSATPGIAIHAEEKENRFRAEVAADVAPGPHLIRAFDERGASTPRFLIVTAATEEAEAEPNDEFAKAPVVARLPATINGRLDKGGDVDSFAVHLEAGQTLIATLDAHMLASPVDPVLRIVDERGRELALNHDGGRSPDPFLAWTAKTAGTHIVQVFGFAHPATADVNFTGNDACVYRLHLSRGPWARHTIPLGMQRGQTGKLRVVGWNLGDRAGAALDAVPAFHLPDATHAPWRHEAFGNTLLLPLGDGPEFLAPSLEPARGELAPLTAPFAVTGCIAQVGARDSIAFNAAKGEKLVFEIQSASLGFPLDAWLAIHDATGKELVKNDDGSTADPFLEWTAPEAGVFRAVVGSVLHRGAADYFYRLSVQAPRPRLRATVAPHAIALAPGKSQKLKVTLARLQGFAAKLTATMNALPAGLEAAPAEAGETAKEIELELKAAPDAAPFSGPIGIELAEADASISHRARHELTATSLNNGVPQGFRDLVIRSTDQIWLTVLPAPAKEPAETKAAR